MEKKWTLLDGATGSNLMRMGMPSGVCVEEWILSHPDCLVRLQEEYKAAGSRILYAPTFGASPKALQKYQLSDKAE